MIVAVSLLIVPMSLSADGIGTPSFRLEFSADGKPASLTRDGGKNRVQTQNPGSGFVLHIGSGRYAQEIPLSHVVSKGDELQVGSQGGGMPRFTFRVSGGERHLALRLIRIEGLPSAKNGILKFEMNSTQSMSVVPFDPMTPRLWRPDVQKLAESGQLRVGWPHLWHRSPGGGMGGFALFCPEDDQDHDETLLEIWAGEGLPHPAVEGEWTVERAREWMREWQETFPRFDQLLVSAKTPEELQQMLAFAERLRVDRIYLHTDTWRGEYWPRKEETLYVNPDVFPRGEPDLRAFVDQLKAREMGLVIHAVCYGFGEEGSRYVGADPDHRLAAWGTGQLERPATAEDTTLWFRPDPGTEFPLAVSGGNPSVPSAYNPMWQFQEILIGSELVRVGSYEMTDQEVWKLTGCQRGLYATRAADHAPSTPVRGLLKAYGQNFVPGTGTGLDKETALEFADFFNRNGIFHYELDGAEIHDDVPWGFGEWSRTVYENTDHPVSSNTSSGIPMMWNMEFRFKSVGVDNLYHSRGIACLMLNENRRLATGPIENHFYLGYGAAMGAKKFDFEKPEPMFGVTPQALETHGLADLFVEQFKIWRELSEQLDPDQRRAILDGYYEVHPRGPFTLGGYHPEGRYLHAAERTENGYRLRPFAIMTREGARDIDWLWGQEFGPVMPRQYLQPNGETLRLTNRFHTQQPEMILRVMNGFDESLALSSGPAVEVDEDLEAYESSAGGTGRRVDAARPAGAVRTSGRFIQPVAADLSRVGDTRFSDEAGGLRIQFDNPRGTEWVDADHLPTFTVDADNTHSRGVGLTVVGDGSGAALVIQLAHFHQLKEYVVELDFEGPRDIVIPSGEVAWSSHRWPFRFPVKRSRYGKLQRANIGLGKVPPGTSVDVVVRNLRLLPETPAVLRNPVIHTGEGSLAVRGDIPSGHYLWYTGGTEIGVYDLNWNLTGHLPVDARVFQVTAGVTPVRITHDGEGPQPWLDLQLVVSGAPFDVPKTTSATRSEP